MTETEWLECSDPEILLAHVRRSGSDRKFRLFACACCRRVVHLVPDPRIQKALAAAEQFADALADRETIKQARRDAASALTSAYGSHGAALAGLWPAARAVELAAMQSIRGNAVVVAEQAAQAGAVPYDERHLERKRLERTQQSRWMRDVFGNPFRPLAGRDFPAHVVGLAQACYDALSLSAGGDDFLVLADALAELGEENASTHCREGGHVKGCHVLDWVLGKA
jgi:hypothetical protein